MKTLELAPQPAEAPSRTSKAALDRKDDGAFAENLRRASSALEPPPDPPGVPDSPPPPQGSANPGTTPSTGEVDPKEPNAQDPKLDSKSNGKDEPNPIVTPLLASEINSAVATISTNPSIEPSRPELPLNPIAVAPAPLPSTPVASLEVAQPVDPKVESAIGVRVRALTPDEVRSIDVAKPDAKVVKADAQTVVGEVESLDFGSDAGTSTDSRDSGTKQDKPKDHAPVTGLAPTRTETTRTESAKAVADPKPIDRDLLTRQLADRIELLAASRPKQGVVVMLQPADLGSITLVLSGDKSDLKAQVFSENDRVREALQQGHPDLVQHLGARGVNLTHLAVSTENKTSASLANSDTWKSPDRHPTQNPAHSFAHGRPMVGSESSAVISDRPSILSSTGVDLWT